MKNKTEDISEWLLVQWVEPTKDYDIHFKRFKRMGALLEWVEKNPQMTVMLSIYKKPKNEMENSTTFR